MTHTLILPEVYIGKQFFTSLPFACNPFYTLIAIFILQFYVCLTTFLIFRSFEKTQAADISFFLFFVVACLLNSSRLYFPLLNLTKYSRLLLSMGNVNMFARLLAPLALFGATVLSYDDQRQYVDRNIVIIIITSLFFTELIPINNAILLPINNAILLPNFCISYGYVNLVRTISLIICILSIISLFISNKKNEYNQLTTIGFAMTAIGYSIMFYCYNLAGLITGPLFLGAGTTIYLNELHNHYMWND